MKHIKCYFMEYKSDRIVCGDNSHIWGKCGYFKNGKVIHKQV